MTYTISSQERSKSKGETLSGSVLADAANDFASKKKPNRHEINAFQELFYTLALTSGASDRKHVSNTLARGLFTPRSIAYYFGLDSLEIAAPMLRYSPVLSNRDLVSLTLRSDFDHVRVIAQRDDLDLKTVNAILSVDDEERTLLNILRASEPLKRNSDISEALAKADRAQPASQPEPTIVPSMGLLAADDVADLSEALLNLASIGEKSKGERRNRNAPKVGRLNALETRLLRNARNLNFAAFAYSVERECKLPTRYTIQTLETKNAGDLASILASLEVSRFIASRIMLILIPDYGRDVAVFKLVLETYQKLDRDECIEYLTGKGARFGANVDGFASRSQALKTEVRERTNTNKRSKTTHAA